MKGSVYGHRNVYKKFWNVYFSLIGVDFSTCIFQEWGVRYLAQISDLQIIPM